MNIVDRMFKFPQRIYEDVEDISKESETLPNGFKMGGVSVPCKWVRGWKRIFLEDITSIGDTFYFDTPIDDVIKNGFEASFIFTDGFTYSCDWTLPVLEKKLIEYEEKINKILSEEEKLISLHIGK